LSDQARLAATDLKLLREVAAAPGTRGSFARDLERARRLFAAGRYEDARAAYSDLRALASGDDRALVELRLAACEYHLKRYRAARDRLRPYLDRVSPEQAEVAYYYLSALRGLRRKGEFVTRARALARDFPQSPWAEAALDALATHYIVEDEDAQAAGICRELYTRFPTGRHAERAAWKAGWWAYRQRDFAEAVRFFESAAALVPRSNYRPSFVYWAGRARARMGDTALARERLALTIADYGGTYYGRLAVRELAKLPGAPPGAEEPPRTAAAPVTFTEPPTAPLIRLLVAVELYDAALDEIDYARAAWGSSPALEATAALVLNRQGEYARGALAIKRAYPQYLTAGSGNLPDEVLKVIFPLDYWALIQKHAAAYDLDPHLMAALVAQESMFDAGARSGANAHGLMQIVPSTGRRVGRTVGLRRVTPRALKDPETSLRLGTKLLADLIKKFHEVHLALAAYNAGDYRVVRWMKERPGLPADEFVDDLPFPETQAYVRRILGTAEDYRRLYPLGSSTTTSPH
jgi:soluble lytic murein transglycosylase